MIFVSDDEIETYDREITLLHLIEACPYCDGPIEQQSQTNPDDKLVVLHDCCDCDRRWIEADT